MRGTLIIEVGRCGLGFDRGLFPCVRLGLVQVAWCRGSLLARVKAWKAALDAALGRPRR